MSVRAKARLNLLVASVNVALERGLITLQCEPVTSAAFEFDIGPYPVIVHINDAGFDEVAIHVIVNPTELGRQDIDYVPQLRRWRHFGAAMTFAWLERRTGKYLQSGVSYHGSKAVTEYLGALTIAPLGFGTKPTKSGYDYHKECDRVFGLGR